MGALAFQWHTRLGAITDVPLGYLIGVLVVDKKSFDRISPADQKIVKDVMNDIFKRMDTLNREDNIKAIEALKNQGIQFVSPSKEELALWKKYAREVIEEAGTIASSPAIHGKVQELLIEYRQQQLKTAP